MDKKKNIEKYPWLFQFFKDKVELYYNYNSAVLMIQGYPKIGKKIIVHNLSVWIMCESKQDSSCGKCPSCILMQSGTHPDCHYIFPEKKNEINTSDVRSILWKTHKSSILGKKKVFIVGNIHFLDDLYLNTLVKILDTVPENTWYIITSNIDEYHILSSYCHIYRVSPPEENWTVSWLKKKTLGMSHQEAVAASRLSFNVPFKAFKLLNTDLWLARKILLRLLKIAVKENDWLLLLPLVNNERAVQHLYWLISVFLDVAKIYHNSSALTINADVIDTVNTISRSIQSLTCVQNIIDTIFECRKLILQVVNINQEIVIANKLLQCEHILKINNFS